jgi:hypothetical protein
MYLYPRHPDRSEGKWGDLPFSNPTQKTGAPHFAFEMWEELRITTNPAHPEFRPGFERETFRKSQIRPTSIASDKNVPDHPIQIAILKSGPREIEDHGAPPWLFIFVSPFARHI